jgi:hypothetical protein
MTAALPPFVATDSGGDRKKDDSRAVAGPTMVIGRDGR